MKQILLLVLLFSAIQSSAQSAAPKWIILEKNNAVGIIKPGINDLMQYIGGKMKNLDKAAFDEINNSLTFRAGSALLVCGKAHDDYIATDIEGRTLVIKGKITVAELKQGSGVGYVKENMNIDGVDVKKGMYVWIKSTNAKNATVTIQFANNKSFEIPLSKVYIIDDTTAEMAEGINFKGVE